MMVELAKILDEDLESGFFPYTQPPDPSWQVHTNALLELTVRRTRFGKILRQHERGEFTEERLEIAASAFGEVFNGDLRKHKLEHYCFRTG